MKQKLLLTLNVCEYDAYLALDLAKWINELGGVKNYDCLLINTPNVGIMDNGATLVNIRQELKTAFNEVIHMPKNHAWDPRGRFDGTRDWLPNNQAFVDTLNIVATCLPPMPQMPSLALGRNGSLEQDGVSRKLPVLPHWEPDYDAFYYFEPDCTPLISTWLSDIEKAYRKAGTLGLGSIYEKKADNGQSIGRVMNGSAVYGVQLKSKCPKLTRSICQAHESSHPWDVFARQEVVLYSTNTPLIQTQFRPTTEDPTWTLKDIRPGAVVVHGCKDGSLIENLRENHATGGTLVVSAVVSSPIEVKSVQEQIKSIEVAPKVEVSTKKLTKAESAKLAVKQAFENGLGHMFKRNNPYVKEYLVEKALAEAAIQPAVTV